MTPLSIEDALEAKEQGDWDYDNTEFPRTAWRVDVTMGDTQLGYFDWVIHQIESDTINHHGQ